MLQHARVTLFPIDWEEPFGLVMIESIACGTPVVATRRGSVPEVIDDGRTGIIVDDDRELVDAIERADALDPHGAAARGRAALLECAHGRRLRGRVRAGRRARMTLPAPWRVVIVTRVAPVALGFHAALLQAGHEPVALLTVRDTSERYGGHETFDALIRELPVELDVLIPARRSAIAPLLRSVQPDLAVCMGFPWKIPRDALEVPSLGWLNSHPSLLPRHRGPVPIAWAIRQGEEKIGVTVHRMDADLDTGSILAQSTMAIGEYDEPDAFYPRLGRVVLEVFGTALAKLAAGDPGIPQVEGEYESFFTDADAMLDLGRPAVEVHRLVWAWRYALSSGALQGALVELDGETVRVLASSLAPVDGARRVECADGPLWLVRTEPVG